MANKVARSAVVAIVAARVILRNVGWLKVEEGYRPMRSGTISSYRAILCYEDALEGPLAFAARISPDWQRR